MNDNAEIEYYYAPVPPSCCKYSKPLLPPYHHEYQGPVVQNLTKLFAKVTLKFLSWNMANTLIFFAEEIRVAFALQSYSHFLSKNLNVFENTLDTTVNKFVINELVKLKVLWTTGPW